MKFVRSVFASIKNGVILELSIMYKMTTRQWETRWYGVRWSL